MNRLMKWAALAAIAALVLAGCEHPVPLETGDGELVTLTVSDGTDSARALSENLAKQGYNYIEAYFKDSSGNYYRVAGYKGDPLRISVPAGAYTSGNTVMFAGRGEDKTLLAIGELWKVGTSETTTIAVDSTSVVFKLYPLLTAAAAVTVGGSTAGTNKVEFRGRQVPYYSMNAATLTPISY